jgi:hypothetical protein
MNAERHFSPSLFLTALCVLLPSSWCLAGMYANFEVAIYIPVNLATDEVLARQAPQGGFGPGRRGGGFDRGGAEQRASFNVHLLPHSYAAFVAEK